MSPQNKSKRQQRLDEAHYKAQTSGGEVEDYLEEQDLAHDADPYGRGGRSKKNLIESPFGPWEYRHKNGDPWAIVRRFDVYDDVEDKVCLPFAWDPERKDWAKRAGLPKGPRILFHLPELCAAPSEPVWFFEGEKKAEMASKRLILIATTAVQGAGNSTPEAMEDLRNRIVFIVPDNNDKGRMHAIKVATQLQGIAKEVRIVELPRLEANEDLEQWLDDRGGDKEELLKLAAEAPVFEPDIAPRFSESALALHFVDLHKEELRYVDLWGRWMRWDGRRWQREETLFAFDEAHRICREAAREMQQGNSNPRPLASAKAAGGVVSLARADRCIAATVSQWDADPWLLNTPGGVVNLRAGSMRAADPSDYMTKVTAVAPDKECSIKLWLSVLRRAMNNDDEMVAYLQRLFGYALTGLTIEEIFVFFFGDGANGKTKIVEAVSGCMGDYAAITSMETFLVSRHEHHSTEIASLCGARLVTAVETDEARRWDAAKIKAMTGGDRITARFMRRDPFTFKPQFKPFVHGNAKPRLRTIDEAMRRRLHLVPFEIVIPRAERDQKLADKLRTEWPGILAWMIEGCVEWQRCGLNPPERVLAATKDYFESQDTMGRWIEERCDIDANAELPRKLLWEDWRSWATNAGEYAGKSTEFYEALEKAGYEQTKVRGDRRFRGLKLKPLDKQAM